MDNEWLKTFSVEVKPFGEGWKLALEEARLTQNKDSLNKEPSGEWKRRQLYSRHSPLRCVTYVVTLRGITREVADHLVRHNVGVLPFVGTQRPDLTGKPREGMYEKTTVSLVLNAESILNISKERLCVGKVKYETRVVWETVVKALMYADPFLAYACKKKCILYGYCPEQATCGLTDTEAWKIERETWVQGCKDLQKALKKQ